MSERHDLTTAIDTILRRYVSWTEAARRPPSVWDLADRALCWHVVLRGVDEPDIDVEVLADALVVRAVHGGALLQAVLPAPTPFDPRRATIRFQASVLYVRLARGDG